MGIDTDRNFLLGGNANHPDSPMMNIRMIIPLMDREAEYRMWKSLLTILLMYLIKKTDTSSKSKVYTHERSKCMYISISIYSKCVFD